MAKRYIVYGLDSCPYCHTARQTLNDSGLQSVYFELESDLDFLEEVKEFYDFATVPIILENDLITGEVQFIGGCSDLLERMK